METIKLILVSLNNVAGSCPFLLDWMILAVDSWNITENFDSIQFHFHEKLLIKILTFILMQ